MITVDLEKSTLTAADGGKMVTYGLGTPEAFGIISRIWLRSGWDTKYPYGFTWMGRPIIQLPEDVLRIQELIYSLKPDVIIETGVAHGGSLILYASLCKAMDHGRVIGIDIEIRPHNRRAIESHELFPFIILVEGNSVDPGVVTNVRDQVKFGERVLVLLDSCHTKDHARAELNAYAPLVAVGSYIVAMDGGIMQMVAGAPRTEPDWSWNNPRTAALEFIADNPGFILEDPPIPFNESSITDRVSYWQGGFIKRIA